MTASTLQTGGSSVTMLGGGSGVPSAADTSLALAPLSRDPVVPRQTYTSISTPH